MLASQGNKDILPQLCRRSLCYCTVSHQHVILCPFSILQQVNGKTCIKHLASSNFISATYSFGVQSMCSSLTTDGHPSKESFEPGIQACLQSFQRRHGGPFTPLVSKVNQKQESREVAITASKFISRSKESRLHNKHTLQHFAALEGLRKNKRKGLEQELQPQNHTVHLPWTHTYLQLCRVICEALHEYIVAYTMLIQQVSNTSACT